MLYAIYFMKEHSSATEKGIEHRLAQFREYTPDTPKTTPHLTSKRPERPGNITTEANRGRKTTQKEGKTGENGQESEAASRGRISHCLFTSRGGRSTPASPRFPRR